MALFDVLTLFVPDLAPAARLRPVQRETAWGPDNEITLYRDDLAFARLIERDTRFRLTPDARPEEHWTALELDRYAVAAANTGLWQRYLATLGAVLAAHDEWVLLAIADCDRSPIKHVTLRVDDTLDCLNEQLEKRRQSFALRIRPRRT